MIEIRLLEVAGFASALQALHLPFGKEANSFASSKSWNIEKKGKVTSTFGEWCINISEHDENLLRRLIKAGDEHAKVLRGVVAYLEINAPRYWWQEMETYRIGHERLSSESTMHIQGKGLSDDELVQMKDELKEGTMQKRIDMFSYQTLRRIYKQRKNHRLPHWREFCEFLKTLPMSEWIVE